MNDDRSNSYINKIGKSLIQSAQCIISDFKLCGICQTPHGKTRKCFKTCDHIFHRVCIKNNTCPFCDEKSKAKTPFPVGFYRKNFFCDKNL